MIRYYQDSGKGTIECDTCKTKHEGEAANIIAFVNFMRRDGWKQTEPRFKGDIYRHYCRSCEGKTAQEKHKVRKVVLNMVTEHCQKRIAEVQQSLEGLMIVPEQTRREAEARTQELEKVLRIIENAAKSNEWMAKKAQRTRARNEARVNAEETPCQ